MHSCCGTGTQWWPFPALGVSGSCVHASVCLNLRIKESERPPKEVAFVMETEGWVEAAIRQAGKRIPNRRKCKREGPEESTGNCRNRSKPSNERRGTGGRRGRRGHGREWVVQPS